MDDKGKLAFLKQHYKKLERETAAREQEMKDLQAEREARHERERSTFELQTEELKAELQKVKELWRTLKEENEAFKQDSSNVASKGAPAEDGQVSAVDRMANVFKNMGRVDFEKECKELRVKLQACEDAVATKTAENTELVTAAAAQEAEGSQTRVALEELRQASNGHDATLSAKTEALEADTEKIRQELSLKQSELDASQDHLRASTQREERLREDYKEEQLKNSQLRLEKQEMIQKLTKAEEQSKLQEQLQQECVKITAQLQQVEAQLQTAEAENSKLQQQVKTASCKLLKTEVALAAQSSAMPELVRMTSTDSKASEDQTESLLLLLESAQQLSEFREFVRQQTPESERYLVFWQDVKDHSELASMVDDADALHQTAGIICEKYLSATAESKISVDQQIVARIEHACSEPQSDLSNVFDEAKKQVLAFVQTELYPQFLSRDGNTKSKPKGRRRRQK